MTKPQKNAASAPLESLRGIVPKVAELTDQIRDMLTGVRARMDELNNELTELLDTPMQRDDFLSLICVDIDGRASAFADRVAREISAEQRRKEPNESRAPMPALFYLSTRLDHDGLYLTAKFLSGSRMDDFDKLCFLFRDEVKRAYTDAFSRVEWPWTENDRPLADMRADYQRITQETNTLKAQEDDILQQASELRIAVD